MNHEKSSGFPSFNRNIPVTPSIIHVTDEDKFPLALINHCRNECANKESYTIHTMKWIYNCFQHKVLYFIREEMGSSTLIRYHSIYP